jgi:uncharacterized membrane protein
MAIVVLIVLVTSIWAAFDVRTRRATGKTTDSAWSWLAACLLMWIIMFPAYLWSRRAAAGRRAA